MPKGSSTAVYFEHKAAPSAAPAMHHHWNDSRERGAHSSARTTAYTVPPAAAKRGASGVARISPADDSGITAKMIAATSAARSSAMRRAVRQTIQMPTAPAV